jgi:magnesium chelatase family protein
LSGTPGGGKSMFVQRLPSLLPNLQPQTHRQVLLYESLEYERVSTSTMQGRPPLRTPHHQTSPQAILGTDQRPGELSLAHGGILFLDEFPEFRRDIVESLREPLETGEVRVTRAQGKITWLARSILCVAMNNCPCGWLGSRFKKCRCDTPRLLAYRRRISGPVLDRIDIHVNLPESALGRMALFSNKEFGLGKTEKMRQKIRSVYATTQARNRGFGVHFNCELKAANMVQAFQMDEAAFAQLLESALPVGLGNRATLKVLRLARTLADLDEQKQVARQHLLEALSWQHDAAEISRGGFAYGLQAAPNLGTGT